MCENRKILKYDFVWEVLFLSVSKKYKLIARIVFILGTVISIVVAYLCYQNYSDSPARLFMTFWLFIRFLGVVLVLYLILRIAARILDCYDKLNRKLSIVLAQDKDASNEEKSSIKRASTMDEESDPYEFYKPPKDRENIGELPLQK